MENISKVKYGLYHIEKKEMLGFYSRSNEGSDFCNDSTVVLSTSCDNEWLSDTAEYAEWVRVFKQQWYNSSEECPVNPYEPYELKVVKVYIKKEYEDVKVTIPTKYEFYKDKYSESNPRHWQSLLENMESLSPYNIYELHEYKNR